jgi:hypothetical protein
VGCSGGSICSKFADLPCDTTASAACDCYELSSIGGGFTGESYDAKSEGKYGAVRFPSASVMEYYEGDTLKWSNPFKTLPAGEARYSKNSRSIVMDDRSLLGVWSFVGSDTLIWWFPGTADGPSHTYVRIPKK